MAVKVFAPAKINLGLEILGKREDGYHEVDMVMQSINLCDEIDIEITNSGLIEGLDGGGFGCKAENNTAFKAAEVFFLYMGVENPGIEINIKKIIPVSAGLAGGSSDAAAVLKALDFLFKTNLSSAQFLHLGAKIGSDVPFCISGGTAHATGSGTTLKPIARLESCFIVVVKPLVTVSTKRAYAISDRIVNKEIHNFDSLMNGIKSDNLCEVCKNLFNRFEEIIHEDIVFSIKKDLRAMGACGALMSGSGPTVFGLFQNENTALKCAGEMKKLYPQSFCCQPLSCGAYIEV